MREGIALFVLPLAVALVAGCAKPPATQRPAPAARTGTVPPPAVPPPVIQPPPAVDYGRLRSEYGSRDDFGAVCERDRPVSRLFDLVERKQWNEAAGTARAWLQGCPVDIDAQLVGAVALKELGRGGEADEHARWYRGLVDSVLASGDGRTPATAYVVISVPEEYAVLRALKLRYRSQALMPRNVDALSVEREDGSRTTVYFNPAAHFARMQKRLAPR